MDIWLMREMYKLSGPIYMADAKLLHVDWALLHRYWKIIQLIGDATYALIAL